MSRDALQFAILSYSHFVCVGKGSVTLLQLLAHAGPFHGAWGNEMLLASCDEALCIGNIWPWSIFIALLVTIPITIATRDEETTSAEDRQGNGR
jgi:hypothetical protein